MLILEKTLLIIASGCGFSFFAGFAALWVMGAKSKIQKGGALERAQLGLDVLGVKAGPETAVAGFWESIGTRSGSIATYLATGGLVGLTVFGAAGYVVGEHNTRSSAGITARQDAGIAQIRASRKALDAYFEAQGRYPLDLIEAYSAAGQALEPDPWGQALRYELMSPTVRRGYRLRSFGADGREGTADDLGDP